MTLLKLSSFQQISMKHQEGKKKINTLWRNQPTNRTRLNYDVDVKPFDKECNIPVINMFKGLMEKVDSIQDQMSNFSKEMETVKTEKESTEMLHTYAHTVMESKNTFSRLICRLNIAKRRISELDRQIQTYNWRLKHYFLSNW